MVYCCVVVCGVVCGGLWMMCSVGFVWFCCVVLVCGVLVGVLVLFCCVVLWYVPVWRGVLLCGFVWIGVCYVCVVG